MRGVFTTVACGLVLAACSSSWTPSLDFLSSAPPTVTARFESEPPGAEARTSVGQTCRTPCVLALPAQDFSVTFALDGYLPQSIPVQVLIPDFRSDTEFDREVEFRPNPVVAALEPAPPPPRKKRGRRKKRPVRRTSTPKPAPAQSAAPPPTLTPSPTSPWPATR